LSRKESYAKFESHSDYPEAVKNNAKRGIELNEKNGNKCATQVGKIRATQLRDGERVTVDTIKRMYQYLSRAKEDYEQATPQDCGYISYLLWGGLAGLRWSEAKLKELEK
jgi:predicted SPOUT superfamily RNA methylase MTH1